MALLNLITRTASLGGGGGVVLLWIRPQTFSHLGDLYFRDGETRFR